MKLSVIIPSYSRPDSLQRLLSELTRQAVDEAMEVLVVDDGSPTPLGGVVQKVAAHAPFRMWDVRVPHAGPIAARNVGARYARGDYLLYLDDDIGVEPNFIQAHIDAHRQIGRGAVSALYVDCALLKPPSLRRWYDDRSQSWKETLRPHLRAAGTGIYRVPGQLLSSTNVSLRRHDFLAIGGFDEAYGVPSCEDMDLGIRLERAGVPIYRIETTQPRHIETRLNLPAICRRQRRGMTATVRLVRRFPEVFGTPAIERVNGPLHLRQDPLRLSLKKLVKSALGVGCVQPGVLFLAAVFGRLPLPSVFHDVVYDAIIGAHIQRGWREGLKLWGGVAPHSEDAPP